MPSATHLFVVGRLVANPELRFTPNGRAVASFTIAVNRQENRDGEWKDVGTDFYPCNVWNVYAENVVNSLKKADNVMAYGRWKSRQYETNDGDKRTAWELDIDEVGPSLRFSTVEGIVRNTERRDPSDYDAEPVKSVKDSRGKREKRSE